MNIVEIQDVDQVYRSGFWMQKTQVLHGITLQIPQRSVVGFIGANGAGKTTLIQLIAGLRRPTAGTVRVGGNDATSVRARALVGYLPERPYFYEHLTGGSLLKYFGRLSGMSDRDIADRTTAVLKLVGMTSARDVMLRAYSKGMLQRIGIAQAILHEPEFLLLDEPMSGLDPLGRKEMRELIVQLAAGGRTIFFSTHVIPDVEAICDQVALIQRGRLIGCGPIARFFSGSRGTEIIFTGLGLEKARTVPGLEAVHGLSSAIRAVVKEERQLGTALQALIKEGGQVVSVNPIRPSLEAMFTRQ